MGAGSAGTVQSRAEVSQRGPRWTEAASSAFGRNKGIAIGGITIHLIEGRKIVGNTLAR